MGPIVKRRVLKWSHRPTGEVVAAHRRPLGRDAIDANPNDHYSDHMATRVTATNAKATLLALLDRVSAGEEIEITRHGRTVARLMPAAGSSALRGSLAGVATSAAPDDDLFSTGEPWNVG